MSNSHLHWELAGLYSETGPLERLLPIGELMVPNDVELEGEWLCWGWGVDLLQWTARRPGPHILSDFVRLADGDGRTALIMPWRCPGCNPVSGRSTFVTASR